MKGEDGYIGIIFEATSASKFRFVVIDERAEKEDLVFSYVEVPMGENKVLVGRIIDVAKENPLLSTEIAGAMVKEVLEGLAIQPESKRFAYTIAECQVIGIVDPNAEKPDIEQNRKPIPPGSKVYPISDRTLEVVLYRKESQYLPIGKIESFGSTSVVPITLDGDELVTKHFAIFGMTGSGKTNTAAKLIEEIIMRGYYVVIFDPHDDYVNINNFDNLFTEKLDNKKILTKEKMLEVLKSELKWDDITPNDIIPIFRTISVLENIPIWELLPHYSELNNGESIIIVPKILKKYTPEILNKLKKMKIYKLQKAAIVQHYNVFPEVKYYSEKDFTLAILEGYIGEPFTYAQRRALRNILDEYESELKSLAGINFLKRLWTRVNQNRRSNGGSIAEETAEVLLAKINSIQGVHRELTSSGVTPQDIEELVETISTYDNKRVHIFSLSTLPNNLRKLMVYAIIEQTFRKYKFNRIPKEKRHPILFILEEARTLVPSKASREEDYTGWLSVKAVRNLAYEGRKFMLGYGIISQKPSTVDHEISSQCNTIILHQLKSPDDQKYVRDVTEGLEKVEIEMLKNIGVGKAVITGTAVKSTIRAEIFRRYSIEGLKKPKPMSDLLTREYTIDNLKNELGL